MFIRFLHGLSYRLIFVLLLISFGAAMAQDPNAYCHDLCGKAKKEMQKKNWGEALRLLKKAKANSCDEPNLQAMLDECQKQKEKANESRPTESKPTPNASKSPKKYVERVETLQPGEQYDFIGEYGTSGLALVKLRGKYGFIDTLKREVIPLKYDDVNYCSHRIDYTKVSWSEFYLMSVCQNGKWGFIETDGNIAIPLIYEKVEDNNIPEGDSFVLVCKDGLWGGISAMTKTNDIMIPFKYSTAYRINEYSYDAIITVGMRGKFGFIDYEGKTIIPLKYDQAGVFRNGLACVVLNNKMGFIDKFGNTIIPFIYDVDNHDLSSFFNFFHPNVCLVKKDGLWGAINRKGAIIVPFAYSDWLMRSTSGNFDLLDKYGKRYYFDRRGNLYYSDQGRSDSSYYRLAENKGDDFFYGREGVEKNHDSALYWYTKAANISPKSIENVGWIYYKRGDSKKPLDDTNYIIALKKFAMAADLGIGEGSFMVGHMTLLGEGCYKFFSIAEEWFKMALDQSVYKAYWGLGRIYYFGDFSVKRDYAKAKEFFEKCTQKCTNDNYTIGDSYYFLGWMYEFGQGVEKDLLEAIRLYQKAVEYGSTNAKKQLEKIRKG